MLKFDRPTLVTITAPTCAGKNYLLDLLMDRFGWSKIVSTTTRPQRAGEKHNIDYRFISLEDSLEIERRDQFAELIEFRGNRYGVTKGEMSMKLHSAVAPMIILEPQGLAIYKDLCYKNNWDVFSIYVHTQESVRIDRLVQRTIAELKVAALTVEFDATPLQKIVATHTDRLLSITTEERAWSNTQLWDAVVPGDHAEKALTLIELGVARKNRKNEEPAPYDHDAYLNAADAASRV